MPTETYDVVAELRLNDVRAAAGVRRVSSRMRRLGTQIRGANQGFGRMTRTLIGLGAAYVGFNAITSGIRGAARSAFEFQKELEGTRIGLATVLAAVERTSFAEGMERSQSIFQQLRDDALTSTATAAEMLSIFQGIVGPIRSAGFELDTVREITKSTVTAATALGVDLGQAQRDISLMVRGAAGMDVKTFSLMRSMGLIAESTEEWNKGLTQAERVTKLQEALSTMSEAGEAFGQSIAGRASSFRDIFQQLRSAFAGPVFQEFANGLGRVNDMLLANRDAITSTLDRYGQQAGQFVARTFGNLLAWMEQLGKNWDQVEQRIRGVVDTARSLAPMLIQAGKMLLAINVGRFALGGALQAGGAIGGIMGAAGGAGLAALAPAILGASAALGVIATTFGWFRENAHNVQNELGPLFDRIHEAGAGLVQWGKDFYEAHKPMLDLVAEGTLEVLKLGLEGLAVAIENLAPVVEGLNEAINGVTMRALNDLARIQENLTAVQGATKDFDPFKGRGGEETWADRFAGDLFRYGGYRRMPGISPMGAREGGTPGARPSVVNDFRGARIQVKQEFRQADPDRVLVQMQEDLSREAERRTQTAFVPALGR